MMADVRFKLIDETSKKILIITDRYFRQSKFLMVRSDQKRSQFQELFTDDFKLNFFVWAISGF